MPLTLLIIWWRFELSLRQLHACVRILGALLIMAAHVVH